MIQDLLKFYEKSTIPSHKMIQKKIQPWVNKLYRPNDKMIQDLCSKMIIYVQFHCKSFNLVQIQYKNDKISF